MALHTWNRAALLHIHLHALVTGGGLAPDGTWKRPSRRKWLLSLDVVRPIFRAKFRDAMLRLIDRGKLRLPPDMTPQQARALVRRAAKREWIVDRRPGYEHGLGVVKYLARYIRGGVLRNSRLLDFDGEEVTFQVSRAGESLPTATLPVQEFIGRILQHVPPHGFRTVRGVGLYAPTNGEKLRRAGEQVGYLPPAEEGELEGEIPSREPSDNPWDKELCSVCGQKLIEGTLPRADPLLSPDAQPRPWMADQVFPVRGPPGAAIFLEELS